MEAIEQLEPLPAVILNENDSADISTLSEMTQLIELYLFENNLSAENIALLKDRLSFTRIEF